MGAAAFSIICTAPLCKPFWHSQGSLGFIPFLQPAPAFCLTRPWPAIFRAANELGVFLGSSGFSGMSALPVPVIQVFLAQ